MLYVTPWTALPVPWRPICFPCAQGVVHPATRSRALRPSAPETRPRAAGSYFRSGLLAVAADQVGADRVDAAADVARDRVAGDHRPRAILQVDPVLGAAGDRVAGDDHAQGLAPEQQPIAFGGTDGVVLDGVAAAGRDLDANGLVADDPVVADAGPAEEGRMP